MGPHKPLWKRNSFEEIFLNAADFKAQPEAKFYVLAAQKVKNKYDFDNFLKMLVEFFLYK